MTSHRGRKSTWAAVGAVLLLAGCSGGSTHFNPIGTPTTADGSPTTAGPPDGGGSTTTSTAPRSTANCTMPLTHATDMGFHIGVPNGWDLSTLGGEVTVASTAAQTEAVGITPALLTNGLTASSFFNSYAQKLTQENAAAGNPVTATRATGVNGMPAYSFTQNDNGTMLQGYSTVEVLPLAAPGATQEAAYIAYWAPQSQFAGVRSELAAIAACFGPESGTPFRVFKDQVFTYAIPPGWTPFDENANGIDLHGPDSSDVSYILDGPVQTSQFDSPQTMIAWFTHGVGITGVTSLSSSGSPQSQASNGGTQSDLYEEFTGQSAGQPVRGLVFSYVEVGGGVASGYIRMLVAPSAAWNSLNGAMLEIAGSIQHDFTQDLATLQQVNQQWQNFNGQVADFSDTLNSQELTKDSNTGIFYEVPYAAWDQNNSRGPGYYLDNGDQLNPVSRS
jgi:hypothetical protein